MTATIAADWDPILCREFEKSYWSTLQEFVAAERLSGDVFPPHKDVFAAFQLTRYAETKVMILGQDPYHGPGQAHGLCFSVKPGVRVPPSLANMYKELVTDVGFVPPDHGSLESWAQQGVLLLNTTLTVRSGAAASHQGQGWEVFSDEVIKAVSAKAEMVVFLLWGAHAHKKKSLIDSERHVILEAPHPSPLSAHRGFFGSAPFSQTNAALTSAGRKPIDWQVPS